MTGGPRHYIDEAGLHALIGHLLADPAHQDNPLRTPLNDLFKHCESQRERQRELPLGQLSHLAISLLNFSIQPARSGLILDQSCRM